MLRVSGTNFRQWCIPGLSIAIVLSVVLFYISYNTGDSSIRSPLGGILWSTWTASDPDAQDYSYCLLVPAMVAYLLFERRSRIAKTSIRGSNAAIAWVVLGLLLFWVGARAGKQYVGCAGLQILLSAVVFWFWGGNVFRQLIFVWAIICFAWPLPFLDTAVAFPLRMIVSHLAYDALNIIGIPCVQNGTALISASNVQLGRAAGSKFQIDIADPCSGLHSLLPLLMFSAFYSHFFVRRAWKQWTVFLSAIPFTVAGNVVRIIMLVAGSLVWGVPFAIGTNAKPSWFHEACGFAVFGVVLGLECLFGILLTRVVRSWLPARPSQPDLAEERDFHESIAVAGAVAVPFWKSGVIVGLAAVLALVYWMSPPVYLPSQAGVVMSLPGQVELPEMEGGYFSGSDAPVTEVEHRVLPKDTEFVRKNYDDLHDNQIFFSIVLSGVQQYTIHPPEVCLVAQGWSIVRQEDIPIHLLSGRQLVVRNLTIQREVADENNKAHLVKAYYMYWYVADGITTSSHVTRNWLSSWDRVFHNRDHRWAYVIAMSAITQTIRWDGLNADQTQRMLTSFIREIVPTFEKDEINDHADNS